MKKQILSMLAPIVLSTFAQAETPSISCETLEPNDPNTYSIVYDITGTHFNLLAKASNSSRPESIPLVASYFGRGAIKLTSVDSQLFIIAKVRPKHIVSADIFKSSGGKMAKCPANEIVK